MTHPSPNAQQIEYWNGPVGERWAKKQSDFDRNMGSLTVKALAFADARPGERVLDIGCGFGTTTMALARSVAPDGRVTGIDISAPMLGAARRRVAEAGLPIELIEADASVHPFAPRYDLLFSRFGVMFFADPTAAFANLHGALKPKGRLAFVCWRAFAENTWAFAPYKAAENLCRRSRRAILTRRGRSPSPTANAWRAS